MAAEVVQPTPLDAREQRVFEMIGGKAFSFLSSRYWGISPPVSKFFSEKANGVERQKESRGGGSSRLRNSSFHFFTFAIILDSQAGTPSLSDPLSKD
jgi:hypothetical protein